VFPYILIIGKQIPAYGVCLVIGLIVVSLGACYQAYIRNLSVDDLIIYIACVTGMALVGAALLYDIVTLGLFELLKAIINFNLKKILSCNGLVFYGGVIGGLLGMIFAAKITKTKPSIYYVSIVPYIPVGHAIGRVGCFCAGCCYGLESDSIFAVKFKNSVTGLSPDIAVIPIQLIEAVCDICIAAYLIKKYQYSCGKNNNVLSEYLILYAIMRFVIEFLRGDSIRGRWLHLSTSQWISVSFLLVIYIRSLCDTVQKKKSHYESNMQ
jgi:phosphatidylglycerol:prolipoprotein diacylglycerol transferase